MKATPEDNLAALEAHLQALGIVRGMDIAVHSRLLSFGRIAGGAEAVYNALRSAVGRDGTLVFPTYSLPLRPDDVYDPVTTPSSGMGALPEYVRSRPDAQRTLCPMHGHVAVGPKAEALMAVDPLVSVGRGSSFDWMGEAGFYLLLLGCTAQEGATFFHHVEAVVGVPYREWIDVPRTVKFPDGEARGVFCRYYGRRADIPVKNDLNLAEEEIRRRFDCRIATVGKRESLLVSLNTIEHALAALISRDPFALTHTSPAH